MPASILPPTKEEVQRHSRNQWHRTFDPHFDTQVAWGYIDGAFPISYGSSLDGAVSGDGEVAFREGAETAYGADLSASTVYIVSSSSSDTQTYSIQGIDANGDYATTTVVATGTTPAAISGTWNHIQRCICTDGVDNVGYVYTSTKSGAGVPATTGDQIQTIIAIGENYAINPMIVVPNSQIFTFNSFDFSQDVVQTGTVKIFARRQGRWIINFKFFVGNEDQFSQIFHTPVRLFEGDAMRVTFTAGGGVAARATFGMNGNVLDVTGLDVTKEGIGEIFK
jgi:hypothetical protein